MSAGSRLQGQVSNATLQPRQGAQGGEVLRRRLIRRLVRMVVLELSSSPYSMATTVVVTSFRLLSRSVLVSVSIKKVVVRASS